MFRSINIPTKISLILLLSILVYLPGCTLLSLLNAPVPTHDLEIHEDLPYGPEPRQALNIYKSKEPGPHPVIVFFYGGRWSYGERNDYMFIGQAMASRGYLTVIPDYRLYPDVRYPAFVKDGARAVAWTKNNIHSYSGRRDQIFLMGHSAGGYIATMLSVDDRWLNEAGVSRDIIKGTIGLSGPYDFLPANSEDIESIFEPASPPERSQPIHYADSRTPPFYLLVGDHDETVGTENTKRFARTLRNHGNFVRTTVYPEVGHVEPVISFAYPLQGHLPVVSDVDRFIQSVIHKPSQKNPVRAYTDQEEPESPHQNP